MVSKYSTKKGSSLSNFFRYRSFDLMIRFEEKEKFPKNSSPFLCPSNICWNFQIGRKNIPCVPRDWKIWCQYLHIWRLIQHKKKIALNLPSLSPFYELLNKKNLSFSKKTPNFKFLIWAKMSETLHKKDSTDVLDS